MTIKKNKINKEIKKRDESQNSNFSEKNDKLEFDNSQQSINRTENDLEKNQNEIEEKNKEKESVINYEEQISKFRDEKLRLLAEMENLRKRVEREKIDSIKFGSINLARDILSLNDNLLRALENMPMEKNLSEPIKNLIDGIKMVQKEFTVILEKHGVKKIDALDNKFDHNFHQAMFEVETIDKEEGIVVQEIQAGFTMHNRLLRPTMVGVSKKSKENKKKA